MRKLLTVACFILLFGVSTQLYAQEKKEIFVDQIEFKLERLSENPYENEYFMTMKLNKGTSYKFRVTNNQNNLPGKAVFELLDSDNMILTNVLNDKYFDNVNFICNKTGFYDILIKYQDQKPGYSVIDIFMIQ